MRRFLVTVLCVVSVVAVACRPSAPGGAVSVLATTTFLADMAQNVAGDRLTVAALLPLGAEPHSYEPTPSDLTKVAKSTVLIVNGAGLEEFLEETLQNVGGRRMVIEASAGLQPRDRKAGEHSDGDHGHKEGDPHFWLDPISVIHYVENIRDGLSKADPAGASTYAANAEAYIEKLKALDIWIREEVKKVPEKNRLLVTNHESLGYFADRYGFTVVGTILQSVTASASPTAQELAHLADVIKQTGAKSIFLETGTNPQLARQLAQEAGITVAPGLYSHSLTDGPPAPTYIEMMKYNVTTIVNALR